MTIRLYTLNSTTLSYVFYWSTKSPKNHSWQKNKSVPELRLYPFTSEYLTNVGNKVGKKSSGISDFGKHHFGIYIDVL